MKKTESSQDEVQASQGEESQSSVENVNSLTVGMRAHTLETVSAYVSALYSVSCSHSVKNVR